VAIGDEDDYAVFRPTNTLLFDATFINPGKCSAVQRLCRVSTSPKELTYFFEQVLYNLKGVGDAYKTIKIEKDQTNVLNPFVDPPKLLSFFLHQDVIVEALPFLP
jgi:hypothetical protein